MERLSEEHKKKLSEVWKQKYKDGYVHSRGMLGKKMGPDTIAKLKGRKVWNKGIVFVPLDEQKRRQKLYSEEYRRAHKKEFVWYVTKRRLKKKGSGGSFTMEEWEQMKVEYGQKCPCCQRSEPEITLHIDHIKPVSLGGRNEKKNIQPLCKSCNSTKHIKIIRY